MNSRWSNDSNPKTEMHLLQFRPPCTISCQVFKSSAKDSTCRSVGIILYGGPRGSSIVYSRYACCNGQGSPMGTQPRPRHAGTKAKAHRHGHAAKAKACMLPRPGQPHGHAAKAKECSSQGEGTSSWARCQGQGMNAAKARVAPWALSAKKRDLAAMAEERS